MRASIDYLKSVWAGDQPPHIHPIWAPTIKLGAITGIDSAFEPALTWQALALGRRPDHMSLVHLNLGLTTRGPYAGLAVTLNGSMDLGLARRFSGRAFRPYLAVHLVL